MKPSMSASMHLFGLVALLEEQDVAVFVAADLPEELGRRNGRTRKVGNVETDRLRRSCRGATERKATRTGRPNRDRPGPLARAPATRSNLRGNL